tara:strand:+ start:4120 stop:5457 length:1338 start_codon:yes stop_codon:yes gene_type:complete
MSSKYIQIRPNNVPADNRIQFEGIPVISFTIGAQNAILDPSSIRIAGKLNIWSNRGAKREDLVHPSTVVAPECMASEKLGIYGAFSQVVWRNSSSKQVVEHIRHYSRFMSSYLPVMSSSQDSHSHLSNTALINPSAQSFRDGVIRSTSYNSFCCPLPTGITLGGEKLPLFESGFGGLDCEVHLAPPQQFFFSNDGTAVSIADCFYELEDVAIFCEVYVPPMDELSRLMKQTTGAFNFNSISSFMTTLESTNSIINFQLGLKRVISCFVNFVPSSFINNLSQNSYLTYFPAKADGSLVAIEDIAFLKNGERFPYEYVVDANIKNDPKVKVVDSQILKEFAASIIPESQHTRTSISPINTNRFYTLSNGKGALAEPTDYNKIPQGGPVMGVGVLYDMLDSDGVDFSTDALTIQMSTSLDDANPNSAYLFVKSKQTIAYSPDGISVVS